MRQFQEKVKKLTIEVLNHDVYIVLTNDVKTSRMKRNNILGPMDLHPNVAGICSATGGGRTYIFLHFKAQAKIIAHECNHACSSIMDFMGAKYEHEIMAYSLTYLIDEVYNFRNSLAKKKKRNKKAKK